MSDEEVRGTIRKTYPYGLLLPARHSIPAHYGRVQHDSRDAESLQLFDTGLIIQVRFDRSRLVHAPYGFSYSFTSRTYYRIVKQMRTDVTAERRIACEIAGETIRWQTA